MFEAFCFISLFIGIALLSVALIFEDDRRFVDVDYEAQLRRAIRYGDIASAMQAIRLLNR